MTTRRTWALAVLLATQLMVILDGTIVNVALPSIREGLGFGDAGLAWVVNGFFVAFAVLLLPAGRLGDLVGSRRVFLAGLAVFTAASALCGWRPARRSWSRPGSRRAPVARSPLRWCSAWSPGVYDDEAGRARGFALMAFVGRRARRSAWSPAACWSTWPRGGPCSGSTGPWGCSPWPPRWCRCPPIGTSRGYGAAWHRAEPWSRGRCSARAAFLLPNAVLFTMTVAGFSFQFLTALYLQDTLGLDALHTGLAYLPVTLAIAVSSLAVSGRLAGRYGAEPVLLAGMVLFLGGLLLMVALPDDGSFLRHVAPGFVVMGAGFGLAMPQVTSLSMRAAPQEHAGAASGCVGTTQQAGGALGLAVVATVAAGSGRTAGFLVAAGALLAGALLAPLPHRAGPPAPPSGRRAAPVRRAAHPYP